MTLSYPRCGTFLARSVLMLSLTMGATMANAAEIKVLSGGPMHGTFDEIVPGYEASSKTKVAAKYSTMGPLLKMLEAGEAVDVVILSAEAMAEAKQKALVDAATIGEVARVGVGIGVKEGAPVPDISTPEAFKKALLAAKSVTATDPTKGTSGKHFAEVLVKLGIAEEMKPKLRLVDGGFAAERVATGEVEMVVQPVTEIKPVKGVTFVGPLPGDLQKVSGYSGAVTKSAMDPAAAKAFLAFLKTEPVRAAFTKKGFQALP